MTSPRARLTTISGVLSGAAATLLWLGCSSDDAVGPGNGQGGDGGSGNPAGEETTPDTPTRSDSDKGAGNGSIDANQTACAGAPEEVDMGDAIHVSCTEAALRSAMQAGGKLLLDCDEGQVIHLKDGHISIDVDVTLDGNGVVLDAGGKSRVFSSNDQKPYTQVFQHVTFRNGKGAPEKYHRWDSPLTDGGAIFSENEHDLTLIDCHFESNESPDSGGESGGGAIVKWGGRLRIVRSSFIDNIGTNGGAIKTLPTEVLIHDSVFSRNLNRASANNGGGAIVHDHTQKHPGGKICGTRFAGNVAYKQGGAVFVYMGDEPDDGDYVIDKCEFTENEVRENKTGTHPGSANGGALASARGSLRVLQSSFSANEAIDHGGAIFAFDSGELVVESSTFYRNSAHAGGAISSGVPVQVAHSTIAYNTAQFRSGGITGNEHFTLDDSILAFNQVLDSANVQNNCGRPPATTGVNLEWPLPDPVFDDNPICTPRGGVHERPEFLEFGDHGGPTSTLPLAPESAGTSDASSCSGEDQKGQPRSAPCALGAAGD